MVNLDIFCSLSAIHEANGGFDNVEEEKCRAIWEERADALSRCGLSILMVGAFAGAHKRIQAMQSSPRPETLFAESSGYN